MDQHQGLLDCIAFMLIKNQQVLAEKRKLTKQVVPGALALPGGHMEAGESPEDALRRELREELTLAMPEGYKKSIRAWAERSAVSPQC